MPEPSNDGLTIYVLTEVNPRTGNQVNVGVTDDQSDADLWCSEGRLRDYDVLVIGAVGKVWDREKEEFV